MNSKKPSFHDYDIYFHNQKDYETVRLALDSNVYKESSLAATIETSNLCELVRPIQIIKQHFGTPEDIFETIDLNCSKIAMTSEGKLIKHHTYSENIKIDFSNFSEMTIHRFFKYINTKDAIDDGREEQKALGEYLIKNYYNRLPRSYHDKGGYGSGAFKSFINYQNTVEEKEDYHKLIVDTYSKSQRLEIFKENWVHFVNCFNRCLEVELFMYLSNLNSGTNMSHKLLEGPLNKLKVKRILLEYPEYFI